MSQAENMLGVIGLNVAKIKKYDCQVRNTLEIAQIIGVNPCIKFEVSKTNISVVININGDKVRTHVDAR